MQSNLSAVIEYGRESESCFHEYKDLLKDTLDWMENIMKDVAAVDHRVNPIGTTSIQAMDDIKEDREVMKGHLDAYKTGEMSKIDLLKATFPIENEQKLSTDFTNIVQLLKSEYADEMNLFVNDMNANCNRYYTRLMDFTKEYSEYFSANYAYQRSSRLGIWRGPQVNIENPTQIGDGGISFWTIWDSTVPIADFDYETEMANLLADYFNDIEDVLNTFRSEMTSIEQSIQQTIKTIDTEYAVYKERRKLNSEFIQ